MTAALTVALMVGACGDPDAVADGSAVPSTSTSTTAPSTPTTTEPEAEPVAAPASCPLDAATASELLDDVPLVLVDNGQPIAERLRKTRISEQDIMHAARSLQGLERMDQVKYAVLERTGEISIIPQS